MRARPERAGVAWETPQSFTWDHVAIEVLMDIRDELQKLNALLHCPNFTGIPRTLTSIRRAIPARRRKARAS